MQDEGEGLTKLRVWTRNYFPKGKTQSIRAMGISTCYNRCTAFQSVHDVPPGHNIARNEILANIEELRNTFMQVDDDGKPRYDELVFPADGRGYFVIDTVPSLKFQGIAVIITVEISNRVLTVIDDGLKNIFYKFLTKN